MIALAGLGLHIETDLPDAALQLVLNAVDEEVTSKFGSASPATEVVTGYHPRLIFLPRAAASLTTVTELLEDGTSVLLDVSNLSTSDVRLVDGKSIARLDSGANPRQRWAPQVTVVYATLDQNRRDMALVQLVKLELAYTGVAQEQDGKDFRMTSADYEAEKGKIIRGLRQRSFA